MLNYFFFNDIELWVEKIIIENTVKESRTNFLVKEKSVFLEYKHTQNYSYLWFLDGVTCGSYRTHLPIVAFVCAKSRQIFGRNQRGTHRRDEFFLYVLYGERSLQLSVHENRLYLSFCYGRDCFFFLLSLIFT